MPFGATEAAQAVQFAIVSPVDDLPANARQPPRDVQPAAVLPSLQSCARNAQFSAKATIVHSSCAHSTGTRRPTLVRSARISWPAGRQSSR